MKFVFCFFVVILVYCLSQMELTTNFINHNDIFIIISLNLWFFNNQWKILKKILLSKNHFTLLFILTICMCILLYTCTQLYIIKYINKCCTSWWFFLFVCWYIDFTGCPDKIGRNLKLRLLHNQKTFRKCKDSFGIVRNRARDKLCLRLI